MKRISEYTDIIESAVRNLQFPSGNLSGLYNPIAYGLEAGGKRIRPVTVLMAADAFGGNPEKAVKPAVGIETFHNFTLLHDDVMDKSDLRRGRPTVVSKFGENAAILSGDTMLTLATEYVTEVDNSILRPVLDAFNRMAIKVYEGQQLDMDFETSDGVEVSEYIEMIRCKTGALLGAAAEIGAIIGGTSENDAKMMYDFGMMTGVAFQIQDDYLDTFGNQATFGKPIGGDILNGKKTFLYVSAMKQGGNDAEALKVAYSLPKNQTRVQAATKIYSKMGMEELCRKEVAAYSSKALKALDACSMNPESKEAFRNLAEKLIGRKK